MKKVIAICITVISMTFFFIGCNAGNFDTEADEGKSTQAPLVTTEPLVTGGGNKDDGILNDTAEDEADAAGDIVRNGADAAGDIVRNGADAAGDIVRNGADTAGSNVRDAARKATRKATAN